jgi:chromosome segregation protein
MKLKTLEIKGFKSFANETAIHFDRPVIGIVGPNGSGKSNIVDAIRWVLGEQSSRELRLDTMSSVIFNGTKKRKAAGMAQVSLTFENTKNLLPTDYHTVTMSRILYRSGESEYRLNNVPCRLKDITSLLLDTGIGSDSYAIIALGMVDDILSNKDNARRRMFEQAAGISKYKVRKRETLNKLKHTTEDLDRVEDLLFEIQNNLNTLEKQAKRTKRYFELKDEYKTLSVQLAILRSQHIKVKQQELKLALQTQEDAYRQVDVETAKLESSLESEKKTNLDKEKALSDRQRDLNRIVGEIRGLESDRKMLEQKASFTTQNQKQLQEQLRKDQERIQQLQTELESFSERRTEEKRLEAQLEDQLVAAETRMQTIRQSHGSVKSDLDQIVQQQQGIEREVFELEKRRAINSNQIDTLQFEEQRLLQNLEDRKSEMSSLNTQIGELEMVEKTHRDQLVTLEKAEEKRQNDLRNTEGKLEELNKKLQQVNRDLDARRNEFKLTQNMIENLEGFPESIRFLSQSKQWKKDAPLLSDLIYVQEDYRVAIENYLEPYLNYYVAENLEEAQRAVKLLHDAQKGKANFFLLDAFEDVFAPLSQLPNTRPAIDLIEVDVRYHKLFAHLLRQVYVTDREEVQEQVSNEQVVLLSRSGRFIQRKISLSGGSIGLFEGKKIGRKKNLEVLEKNILKAEKEANSLSTQYYNLKERLQELKNQNYQKDIQHQNAQLNQLGQRKVSLLTKFENFEQFTKEAHERRQKLQAQIEQLQTDIVQIAADLERKQGEVSGIKEKLANTDGSFREIADQLSEASTAYNAQNIEFIRQQNKVETIQRELSFREKQLEETRLQIQRNERNLENSATELEQTKEDSVQLELQLQELYKSRKEREALLTEAEQNYYQARGGIHEMEDELRKLSKRRQDLQIAINQQKDKLTDLRYQINAISERLQIEFQLSLNDVINQPIPEELNSEELQMRVERMKSRLDNYGEINPMAVEAYDEMKGRHDTISVQRDDILKAKEDLLQTIKEIEETATAQFLDSFSRVRLFFIDVFRSLFTIDDTCDLLLLDPENPLESDIEIVAKPKGKRPQTIAQLSGGEKTLTATALLFALYLLKPAPFCIFDEVDAPLDDANIEKFNRIIKKFSQDSQFIIVTHNKQTMAAVDTIYGVYMQEQGVSGVSPVDFRTFEQSGVFEVGG